MSNPKDEQAQVDAAVDTGVGEPPKTSQTDKTKDTDTQGEKKEVKKVGKEKEQKPGTEKEPDEKKESDLFVNFSIEVSAEEIDKKFEEAAVRYAGEVKMPGFRKGKVPIEVVKSRFKDIITDEVVEKAIEQAVFDRVDKEKMKIASSPLVEKVDHKEGENLKADIKVELFPEITLPDLEKIEIEVPAKELNLEKYDEQKQVDAFLEANRKRVSAAGREIKEKDYIDLKYQSKILDTKRMTPRKEAHYFATKDGEFEILDLYDDIIGKKLNDKITVRRKYPDDYKKKIWAGKEIEHYIEIKGIFESVKPTLNKEFLQEVGFSDEESFKKQLKEDYDRYEKSRMENKISQAIADKLIEIGEFPIPQTLVERETIRIVSGYARRPLDFKNENEARELLAPFKPQAEKSIKLSLIIDSIKEKFKIEVNTDDLEQEYKKIAEKNNIPQKEVRKYYLNSKKDMQDLKETLLNVKVMDFLRKKIKIKEV